MVRLRRRTTFSPANGPVVVCTATKSPKSRIFPLLGDRKDGIGVNGGHRADERGIGPIRIHSIFDTDLSGRTPSGCSGRRRLGFGDGDDLPDAPDRLQCRNGDQMCYQVLIGDNFHYRNRSEMASSRCRKRPLRMQVDRGCLPNR